MTQCNKKKKLGPIHIIANGSKILNGYKRHFICLGKYHNNVHNYDPKNKTVSRALSSQRRICFCKIQKQF